MSQQDKKIIAFHQLNDFSGSPKVLSMTLNALLEDGYDVDLVTTKGGCLDLIKSSKLKKYFFPYRFSPNKIATFLRSALSQLYMSYYGLRYGKGKIFFINTIMPVGGALAGKLLGSKVLYHYHENAFQKGVYYKIKAKIMLMLADQIICVSNYQKNLLPRRSNITVIPNALFKLQKENLIPHAYEGFKSRKILLVSSLRTYKGVSLFARLAQEMPDYKFILVANADEIEIKNYFKAEQIVIPSNLTIFPRKEDVSPFYNSAGLLLNLSDKSFVVETFGLTVIEAMAAGVPVIVPDEGGVVDLVQNGENGFVVDVRDVEVLKKTINKVFSNYNTYKLLSDNAIDSTNKYSEDIFKESILNIIVNE
ncbi:MAG: glycosyltransferase family 4 protein [Muribaculaceae bacterium]|nr:glycosyltransferase family 4 protein [Muribaculaceae bacterium]